MVRVKAAQTKVTAFGCAIVLFLVFGGALFMEQREATKRVVVSFPATMWALNKIELEYSDFTRMISLYRHGAASYEDLVLAFDIFWSRVDLSMVSDETRLPRQMVGVRELLDEMKWALELTEPELVQLPLGDSLEVRQIQERFLAFEEPLGLLAAEYFSSRSTDYRASLVNNIFNQLILYFAGLLVSGFVLIALLFREVKDSRHYANHDGLTGLPNRGYFNQVLEAAAQKATRGNQLTVLLIDLNGFKQINDQLGHRAGDEVLQHTAKRINATLNTDDFAARLGGDEFAVLLRRPLSDEEALAYGQALVEAICRPVTLKDGSWHIDASVGVGRKTFGETGAEELLFDADMAMYHAKQQGAQKVALCDEGLQREMARVRQLEGDLRKLLTGSLNAEELYVCYQPLLRANSNEVYAVEALLRWQHPTLGAIAPQEIIDVAETHGLGAQLGEWVLTRACDTLKQFQRQLDVAFKVSVNVSPAMYQQNLAGVVEKVASLVGVKPSGIMLEITERTAMSDVGDEEPLVALRELGVGLVLDDFGTGLSSLSYLDQLPMDVIKLDRLWLANHASVDQREVLTSVLSLAKSYGLRVVCEGAEDDALVNLLAAQGCDYFQGDLFAKPMLETELFDQLTSGKLQFDVE
ncbi:MAG: putative bifunctional diguanylate cyclase/phosphodiesterase [Pontibacterium sp.]